MILSIKVKPQAKVSLLTETSPGVWAASLKAPPVDGKANAELIRLVAEHFGVRKADVQIKSGAASRMKRVEVLGL